MRTLLVNGLAVLALTSAALSGCSNADARTAKAAVVPPPDSLVTKADLGRIDGAPTAKIWVVEVSDLQCPYCKAWHDKVFPGIRDEFVKTGKIRLAYVNFPLSQHMNAASAANAAMCASAQNKFWDMHDAIFATQEEWEKLEHPGPFFENLAAKTGVNMTAWKACIANKTMQPLIEADMDRAKRAGVQSTPSFIVGGRLLEGARPIEDMRKAINDALSSAR